VPGVTGVHWGATRRAASLAELVVALGIAAVLYALGGMALVSVERRQRDARSSGDGRRAVRETISVLAEALRGADSVSLRGDTAVEALGLVGTSVVCATEASGVVLPPAAAESGLPFTAWREAADTADVVAIYDVEAARWWYAGVGSVSDAARGSCLPASGLISPLDSARRLPLVRLTLERPLPASVGPGAPARILRRSRHVLHRSADGGWGLAYRRCTASSPCGGAQPVTGPLASASDGGLGVSFGADSSVLLVTVRAPRRLGGAPGDSARGAFAVVRAR
jgi:hypothetical protein